MSETRDSWISSSDKREGGSIFLKTPKLLKSSPTKERKIGEKKIGAWGVSWGKTEKMKK